MAMREVQYVWNPNKSNYLMLVSHQSIGFPWSRKDICGPILNVALMDLSQRTIEAMEKYGVPISTWPGKGNWMVDDRLNPKTVRRLESDVVPIKLSSRLIN